jgi:hypothetical protein
MSTYQGELPCDTVTFHEVKRGAEFGPGFRRPLGEVHGEVARVALGTDRYAHFTPDRPMYLQAVAWDGDTAMYVFQAALIGARSECRVGPFPLAFTASDTSP